MPLETPRVAAAGLAVALVVGVGAALAAGISHSASRRDGDGAFISTIATYLSLSPQQLRADLAAGQTLAQIASAQGKSVSGLEQTIESAVKSRLDQAVTAGKISAQQEQLILTRLPSRLDRLVNVAHPGAFLRQGLWRRKVFRASAAYLGLTAEQLKTELKSGRTLAQIASAQGKTAAGLEQAIETAVKAKLDKAVAAGRISADREQKILERLSSRLDLLVNRSFANAGP